MSSLTILYGTQNGTAERLAYRLGRYGLLGGAHHIQVLEADEVPLDKWISLSPLLFVCSNANQGDAPLSIKKTWQSLLSPASPLLDGLFFAVFGVGDSLYEKFNYMPKMLHNRLVQLHAVPLCYRGLGDESDPHGIEEALVPWVKTLWITLGWGDMFTKVSSSLPTPPVANSGNALSSPSSESLHQFAEKALPLFPLYEVEIHNTDGGGSCRTPTQNCTHRGAHCSLRVGEKKNKDTSLPTCRSLNHFVGEVVENQRLTAEDHFQAVHQIKLILSCPPPSPPPQLLSSSFSDKKQKSTLERVVSSSLPTFLPGDALGVFVPNQDAQVDLALQVLGYTGEEVVIVKPRRLASRKNAEGEGGELTGVPLSVATDAPTGQNEPNLESWPSPSSALRIPARLLQEGEDLCEAHLNTSVACSSLCFEQHSHRCVYDQSPMTLRHLLTYYVDLDEVVSQDFLWMLSRLVILISSDGWTFKSSTSDGSSRAENYGNQGDDDTLRKTSPIFLTTTDHQTEYPNAHILHRSLEEEKVAKLKKELKDIEDQANEIRERLLELSDPAKLDGYLSYAHREKRNVVETLMDFVHSAAVAPCSFAKSGINLLRRVPLDLFLTFSTWMRPRYYSISSSPTLDSGFCVSESSADQASRTLLKDVPPLNGHAQQFMVHLTVAQLKFTTPLKRHRVGLCSSALTSSTVGSRFECCRWEGSLVIPDFPLPLVCIATGSGIAPVRCILREWASKASGGTPEAEEFRKTPIYLFFGCRNKEKDFLYAKEWEELQSSESALPRLQVIPAFSRDGAKKMYVSHKLGEHAKLIGDLLLRHLKNKEEDLVAPPVVIYVCGNAKQMPKDVSRTLRDIVIEKLKKTKVEKYKKWLSHKREERTTTTGASSEVSAEDLLPIEAFHREAEKEANLLLQAMHYEGRYQVDTWSI